MRRLLITSSLLLLFAGSYTQSAEPVDKPPKGEEYFPISIGKRWTYRIQGQEERLVITAVTEEKVGNVACIRLEGRLQNRLIATEHIALQKGGVYRYRNDGLDIEPPLRICKFPPEANETWKVEYKVNDKKASLDYECDFEEVKVPAGTYQALVVRSEVPDRAGKLKNTVWYAPKVGMVRQLIEDGDSKIELRLERVDHVNDKKMP